MSNKAGYSDRLREFLLTSRPDDVELLEIDVQNAISKYELDSLQRYGNPSFKIGWVHEFSEDGLSVVFRPYYITSGESDQIKRAEEHLLSLYKTEPVIVELPERAILMPVPDWTWAYDADGNGWIVSAYTTRMFVSEANEYWEAYQTTVNNLLSGKKKKEEQGLMFDYLDEIWDLSSGRSYDSDIRAKRLREINKTLKPQGIRLVEVCSVSHPVEGITEITQQDIVLKIEANRGWGFLAAWQKVAILVPGEDNVRVKDGVLPDDLGLKTALVEGENVPDYFKNMRISFLLFEDKPIMIIRAGKVQVHNLGHKVDYYWYRLHYINI